MQTEIGKQTQIWEKGAKKQLLAVMAVIIVAILGFAGWKEYQVSLPQRINELKRLEEITEGNFTVAFACHDGNSGIFWMSSSDEEEKEKASELVEKLSQAKGRRKAISSSKWDIGKIAYPMYSVCVIPLGQTDLRPVYVLWSNGLLYDGNGSTYKCEIDFSDFIAAEEVMTNCFSLDEVEGHAMFRGFSELKSWVRWMLKPSDYKGQPAIPGIRFENTYLTLYNGKRGTALNAEIHNETGKELKFSTLGCLEVQIDYAWYKVPRDPRYGFESAVARLDAYMEVGECRSVDFDTSRFGNLPKGKYRLVVPVRSGETDGVMYIEFEE